MKKRREVGEGAGRRRWKKAKAAWRLAKTPLCMLIACSAGCGALLATGDVSSTTMAMVGGVLLTAMGGATWNSLQEEATDALMRRTEDRPLPRRQLSHRFALLQGTILTVAGLALLSTTGRPMPPLLAIFALLLYNLVYTPLKQKSLLAMLPGTLCGALPPLIGYTAQGGDIYSYPALLLAVLLVLWQVPHFSVILIRYRVDYEGGVQPNLLTYLPEAAVRRCSCVWIWSLVLVMLLFTVVPLALAPTVRWLIVANTLVMATMAVWGLLRRSLISHRLLFLCLNLMLFNHMVLLAVGRLLPVFL